MADTYKINVTKYGGYAMKNKGERFVKVTKAIALLVLTFSVSFEFIGCTINESKTIMDNKDAVSYEEDSSDNIIEHRDENKNQGEHNEDLSKSIDFKKDNEKVIISFSIVDSDKNAALCISEENPDYIVFRFGTSENLELEFPDNLDESWDKFTYSYYIRGGSMENEGLDLNYVTFEYSGVKYEIFQEYSSEIDATDFGIRITDLTSYEETILKATKDSIEGDLRVLRDCDKIKTEIQ